MNKVFLFVGIIMLHVSAFPRRTSTLLTQHSLYSSTVIKATTNTPYVKTTGAFKKKLIDVYPSSTHYKRALRGLKGIKADLSIKNARNQNRKLAAQTLDELMKKLTIPITDILNTYRSAFRDLHPFEATVADLTIISRMKAGEPHLNTVLEKLKTLRVATSKVGKDFASRANNASTALEAREIMAAGVLELEALYTLSPEAKALEELVEIQKDLRRIPIIELDTPTVVLVGSPNVGKSSIVRAVSSGTPEVNDYPFTTRGVTIGHIGIIYTVHCILLFSSLKDFFYILC